MVEQAGSLAGFAAVIGLAVLSALYFSQARDLRRLREWAGRAPERAAEMGPAPASPIPGRVVATPQRPPQATGPAAPPAPATTAKPGDAASASNGDAAPSVAAKPGEGEDADAEKAGAAKSEGDEAGSDAASAKPGMPAPASAAAAAGAGAASASGPAAPSAPPATPGSAPGTPGAAPDGPGSATPGPAKPGPAGPASAPGSTSPASSPGATPAPAAQGSAPAGSAPASAPSGSASPPTGSGPRTTPQRTPGSVLPPRTGTMPPVRRLPSAQTGGSPAQTGILGQAPPKKKRNPLYVALAVVGVLILGAAAAVGVPAIVNGAKDNNKTTSSKAATKTARTKTQAAVATSPSKITVAVLNGTSIPGLAAPIGDRVDADGFTLGTVSNASQTQGNRANSVAMYARGHEKDAQLVAKKLGIRNVTPVDSSSQQIAGDATVVVIVGGDKTQ